MDVFKRDVKGDLMASKVIRHGNALAHEGDALSDALLFARDSEQTGLYTGICIGLNTNNCWTFSASDDGGFFLVLNAHATMVVHGNVLPEPLKVAFDRFLEKVEQYWKTSPNRKPNSSLGCAYYSFWKVFNQQTKG